MHWIPQTGFSVQNLIKWLSYGKKIHINIHYFSGTLQEDEALCVMPQNKFHYCSFCNTAKTTSKGLDFCMRNKRLSIKKALFLKRQYVGRCYLGITEIVKPVFREDVPFCIIYVGNIITEEGYDSIRHQIERMTRISGVKVEQLYAELETVERISSSVLEEYTEIAEILSSSIELYLNGISGLKSRQLHKNTIEKMHWVVRQTIDYIHQFYYTDIKLSQIADLYFINEQYLCKLFSKQLGERFSNYVNRVRIEQAKELLCSSQKKMIEISSAVGFNNVTYFNSVFKKYTHLTPKEYKIQYTKQ